MILGDFPGLPEVLLPPQKPPTADYSATSSRWSIWHKYVRVWEAGKVRLTELLYVRAAFNVPATSNPQWSLPQIPGSWPFYFGLGSTFMSMQFPSRLLSKIQHHAAIQGMRPL